MEPTTLRKNLKVLICIVLAVLGVQGAVMAQSHLLNGVVTDEVTHVRLPNVRIVVNISGASAETDLNGLFTVRSQEPIRQLLFTKLGYRPRLTEVSALASPLMVVMTPENPNADSLLKEKEAIARYLDSVRMHTRMIKAMKRNLSLMAGRVELGWFTLETSKLKRYNEFEGLYLGLGGHTNERLSKLFSLGGYWGYGFKDERTKYGLDLSLSPDKAKRFVFQAGYSDDVRESGGSRFFDERSDKMEPASFRFFYVNKMDWERKLSFSVSLRYLAYMLYGGLQQRIVDRGYDISNGLKVLIPNRYNVSGIVAGIRLAPGQNASATLSEGDLQNSVFPVVWFQLTKGIPGWMGGTYRFNRLESKMLVSRSMGKWGRSTLQVVGDLLHGNAPYFEYFNGRGAWGNWGLYASGSFVTMHPDEFLNDRSLDFFFTHRFGSLMSHPLLFNPSPALVVNYGLGRLSKPPDFYFLRATDLHLGYLEAGIQLNSLLDLKLYGVGLGAYWRMGAYAFPSAKDNLALKIVVSFP